MSVRETNYQPQGAVATLFEGMDPEEGIDPPIAARYDQILVEGPSGSGKTLAILMMIHAACMRWPGMKVLMVRETRESMTQSVLATYEEQVLANDEFGDAIMGKRKADQRSEYDYPKMRGHALRSRIVACSANDIGRIKSSEWSIVYINECTDLTLEQYGTITSRMRPSWKRVSPFQLVIADCNPDREDHWLNQHFMPNQDVREREPGDPPAPTRPVSKLRLFSPFTDNPLFWDSDRNCYSEEGDRYAASLNELPGALRDRYFIGRWCSETGLVYPEFKQQHHVIKRSELPPIVEYACVADWGWSDAGVLQTWGFDARGRMYLVHETYAIHKLPDFWADAFAKVYLQYDPVQMLCDSNRPDMVEIFRAMAGRLRKRHVRGGIVNLATKWEYEGVMLVKDGLSRDEIFFVDDACDVRDRELAKIKGRPTNTIKEFGGYAWEKQADGQPNKERPEKNSHSDGLDCVRYMRMWAWKRAHPGLGKGRKWKPGTMGEMLKSMGCPGT